MRVIKLSVLLALLAMPVFASDPCPALTPTNTAQIVAWLVPVFTNLGLTAVQATNAVNALTPIAQQSLYSSTRLSCIYSNFSTIGILSNGVMLINICLGNGIGFPAMGITNSAGPWEIIGCVSNWPASATPGFVLQPQASTNASITVTTQVDNVSGAVQ
jgi:hypothetical protein